MHRVVALHFTTCILVGLFCGQVSRAQESTLVHYVFDRPEPLTLDSSRIAVFRADANASVVEALARYGLDANEATPWPIRGWWLVPMPFDARSAMAVRELVANIAGGAEGLFASPVFVGEDDGPVFVTQHVLVKFDAGLPANEAELALRASGVASIGERGWADIEAAYRVTTSLRDGFEVLALANALAQRDDTDFAEPDFVFTGGGDFIPNDAGFGNCWGLHNTGQSGGTADMDMDAPAAWDITTGAGSVIVVVIDTGVERSHPDLQMPLGNDFTGEGTTGDPFNACDVHGTAVAGCIGALINNSIGTVGIAPTCQVRSARAFTSLLSCNGSWTTQVSWTVDALAWAHSIGARVTNNSNIYGFTASSIEQKYADTEAAGVLHFACAGNSSQDTLAYPSILPSVNAVAALNRNGVLASFSNFGPGLAFSAPGASIYSTDRTGAAGYTANNYATVSGTSFASPYTAGVAALVLSRNPNLGATQVEQILQQTCVDRGVAGYDTTYGWGFVNAHAALLATPAPPPPGGSVERVSISSTGVEADFSCGTPTMSSDGRYVAFATAATNLVVPSDTNAEEDIYVRDRSSGTTTRVSVGLSAGTQPNRDSRWPYISGDGRFVAFESDASNLVSNDTNGVLDIFVHDRLVGTTSRVSLTSSGQQADNHSREPSLSSDGRYVAFYSSATNLVVGDTNAAQDIFVRDRDSDADGIFDEVGASTTQRVNLGPGQTQAAGGMSSQPRISGDGRYVAYRSDATSLTGAGGNGFVQIYRSDCVTGLTSLVSVSSSGAMAANWSDHVAISESGRFVAFHSEINNGLVTGASNAVYVHDCLTALTTVVSVSSLGKLQNNKSDWPSISADGRFVAFLSDATNLVSGDTNALSDVFVHDRQTGTTVRTSSTQTGAQSTGAGSEQVLAGDGRSITFRTSAADILPPNANSASDLYWRDLGAPTPPAPAVYCTGKLNSKGCTPSMSSNGIPSVSASSSFNVTSSLVINNKSGLLFYGFNAAALPFQGGTMCVAPPKKRTAIMNSGGHVPPDDCTGSYAYDFNALIQSGAQLELIAGTVVFCQFWYRDPATASATGLSNALRFAIGV